MPSLIEPLQHNVPIVDPKTGYPTPQFQRILQELSLASSLVKNPDGSIGFADVAANRVLGSVAGGSPAALTITQVLDMLTGAAQGDVIYRGASAWDNLAAGTSGKFLKTQGAGADPVWDTTGGSTAWALAGTGQTATGIYDFAVDGAKANIDFAGLGSFNELLVIARGLSDGTSGQRALYVSVDNGSTFYTSSGNYKLIGQTGVETNTAGFAFHETASTAARSFAAHIVNMKGVIKFCHTNTATGIHNIFDASSSDINAIRVANTGGGNITAGTVRVFAR